MGQTTLIAGEAKGYLPERIRVGKFKIIKNFLLVLFKIIYSMFSLTGA